MSIFESVLIASFGAMVIVVLSSQRPLLMFAGYEISLVSFGAIERLLVGIPYINLFKDVYLAAFLLGGIAGTLARGRRIHHTGLLISAAACVLAASLSFAYTPELLRGLAALRFYLGYPLLIFASMLIAKESSVEDIRKLLLFNMGMFTAVCLFGLIDYLASNSFSAAMATDTDMLLSAIERSGITGNAVVGTLGNRPNMGSFACLGFLLAIGLHDYVRGWTRRFLLISAGITLAALLLTFSRSAYIAVAVGTLVLTWKNRKRVWYLLGILVVAPVVVITAMAFSGASIGTAVGTMDLSLSGRVDIWLEIMDQFSSNVFGVGLGSFGNDLNVAYDIARKNQGNGAVDSSYLLVLFEQGIQGLAALIAVVWSLFLLLFRAMRVAGAWEERAVVEIAIAWLVALATMAISTDMFHIVFATVPLYWFVGCAIEVKDWKRGHSNNRVRR